MATLSSTSSSIKKVLNCYHANIGACNGCDLEVLNLLSTFLLKKIDGGLWKKSYNIIGGIDKILQVNCFVPGCPPTPESILYSLESALSTKKKLFTPHFYKEK
jgi:Ni,Fe-hydrogenase III small subunit